MGFVLHRYKVVSEGKIHFPDAERNNFLYCRVEKVQGVVDVGVGRRTCGVSQGSTRVPRAGIESAGVFVSHVGRGRSRREREKASAKNEDLELSPEARHLRKKPSGVGPSRRERN